MSDPKCPCCGREMLVPVYRDYFNKTWIACCRCNECEAKWKTGDFTGETKEEAAEKARAAAIRRPQQKPLTLDELFPGGIERSPDVMWIEFKGQHSLEAWKPAYSGEDFVYWFNQINYEKDRYNKTWRCWLGKPTDEERAAAPWEV